jgi:HEAT repeat protein
MVERRTADGDDGLANLAIDPDVLARELAAELLGDPLDEIDLHDPEDDVVHIARECDEGLHWLKQGHQQRLQGLRVFCEHRDPRAVPLLLPLLSEVCPVVRMSAVYAWSLGNYPDAPVLNPLIRSLQVDVASVRLWASVSLAEAGITSAAKADLAAGQLLISLRIDSEPVVRSNCIWALGRLVEQLVEPRCAEVVEAFVNALLHDQETSVRDEARTALEQMENPEILERLQTLVDEGLL